MSTERPELSVGICAYNRTAAVIRCILSLRHLALHTVEVLVIDDASEPPLEPAIRAAIPPDFPWPLTIIRNARNQGYIPNRNLLPTLAKAPYLLMLDDDAYLRPDHGIGRALEVLESDPAVAVVALGQTDPAGELLWAPMQPAPVPRDCYVRVFYGYGHLFRPALFAEVGPYRTIFEYYREEVEFSKRLMCAGKNIVYLVGARVVHCSDQIGRSEQRRLRYGTRNACFDALYNEPFPMLLASIPLRLIYYLKHRRTVTAHYGFSDRGGLRWLLKELLVKFPRVWRERKSLGWATYRKWRRLAPQGPNYVDSRRR